VIDVALRVMIAVVLAWAATTKIQPGAAPVLDAPRTPRWLARASSPALALIEIAIATLVLVPATAAIGGVCAAVLGGIFTVVLAARWARGANRMRCNCFGGDAERPAWLLCLRAMAIAGAGVLVALEVDPAVSRDVAVSMALGALAICVGGLLLLVLALYRQVGVLERRLGPRSALEIAEEGPPFGERAPAIDGVLGIGSEVIAFGSDRCRLCRELEPGLRALGRDGQAIRGVNEDTEPDVFNRFGVPGTPYIVHTVDGVVVAKGLVNTLEQVEELIGVGLERAQYVP